MNVIGEFLQDRVIMLGEHTEPMPKCSHISKTKQQVWVVAGGGVEELACRDCALPRLLFCTHDGEPASIYFIYEHLRGPTGNDPNYFIASGCGRCCADVPEGDWGVRLLEFRNAEGKLVFMNVRAITSKQVPLPAVPKKRKMKEDDELELA